MSNKFKGTGVALVTPFTEQGSVDFKGLGRLVEHLIKGGVDYLVVQGTTGESPTLTPEEKRSVVDFVVEVNNGRRPVVLGHGGNNTHQILRGFGHFDFTGIDAILSVSPAYNKPTQEGIYQHFKAIAEASPVPVILYNVPPRTGSNMTSETTLRLAHNVKNVVAIKEASGDLAQIGRIIRDRPAQFMVISGDDALVVPHMALGGDGIISVVGNALPGRFSKLVNYALEGNFQGAREVHYNLMDVITLLFAEGNPGGVKAALKILGICGDDVRLPLVKVSAETYNKLDKVIKSL